MSTTERTIPSLNANEVFRSLDTPPIELSPLHLVDSQVFRENDAIQNSHPPRAGLRETPTSPTHDTAELTGRLVSAMALEDAKRMMDPFQITYMSGWRLNLIMVSILIGLFLANIEVPIVNTALVSITNDLGGFDKAPWIISGYLLGYVATVMINAKLSDIFGRKALILVCFGLFIVWSAGCGGAQTINQLIVFRALKGLGGSGLATIPVIMLYDLVPPERLPIWATGFSLTLALANALGPILGGVISQDSTWRWIFLMNIPIGFPFAALCAILIPPNFPYHGNPNAAVRSIRALLSSRSTLKRVDFLGSFTVLVGTVFFVTAFQGAGTEYPWRSGFIVSFLVICVIVFIIFIVYSWFLSRGETVVEPIFPWRFIHNRVWMGMVLIALFHGIAWVVPIYQIPQRMEVVHRVSPVGGGTRLLPFTIMAPISSIVTAALAKKGIAPIYMLLLMSLLQIIGFACLATLPYSQGILARQYGFEIIAGVGCGPMTVLLPLVVPYAVEQRDRGVGMAALTQVRMMGGVMGLSIVTTAMNNLVRPQLSDILNPMMMDRILKSPELINELAPAMQDNVRMILNDGFNLQMKIVTGLCGMQVVGCLMMYRKPQILIDGSQAPRPDPLRE